MDTHLGGNTFGQGKIFYFGAITWSNPQLRRFPQLIAPIFGKLLQLKHHFFIDLISCEGKLD